MKQNKAYTMYKETYVNRYDILINKHTETPGPGDYDKQDKFQKQSFLQFQQQKQRETLFQVDNQPGPTDYSFPKQKQNKKIINFNLQLNRESEQSYFKVRNIPGPGKYDAKLQQKKSNIIFGKTMDPRTSWITYDKNPGPGSYGKRKLSLRKKDDNFIICSAQSFSQNQSNQTDIHKNPFQELQRSKILDKRHNNLDLKQYKKDLQFEFLYALN